MAVASSTAALIAAGISAATAIGTSAYSANQQRRAQDEALRAQRDQQAQAEQLARDQMNQQRQLEEQNQARLREQEDRLNRQDARSADANTALMNARNRNRGGNSSTMLTGTQGVSTSSLPLGGRPSLLG